MAGNKYLSQNAGALKEVVANDTSAGAGDAGKLVALDSTGKLDTSMMPSGIAADTASIVTSENLGAGDFVNIYDVTGTPTVRKADATAAGQEAHGFVLAATTSPAACIVYFEGLNNQLSGLVAGTYFLDTTTAGGVIAVAPSSAGNIVQRLGIAHSATELNFERSQPVELA